LQTSIGNQIDVNVVARDEEDDTIEYRWTATSGSFANPSVPRTTYTCEELGVHTITITVSDDGFEYCDCFWDVDVTCVDGDGGTGGTGGTAGAGGMGGMAGAGGMGGMAGGGGMGGMGGSGGGICIPDGGAQWAGEAMDRVCGEVSCDEMEACVAGACEPAALVFVSSTVSDAALGGPRGADRTCADLAEASGLGGYWFSWTSDACTSPSQRFEQSTLPYRMVDGSEVSPSWERMTMPPPSMTYLGMPIDLDEDGVLVATPTQCNSISNPCEVWTNTTVAGEVHPNNGCLALTTDNSIYATSSAGKITSVSQGWTQVINRTCGTDNLRLYCFEQSTANP
jgi:hypothetical protein